MHIAEPIHSPQTQLQILLDRAHYAHLRGDKPAVVGLIESIFALLDRLEAHDDTSQAA